jgi:exopolyphosphatase/guanosine-5'-triphosphate,3'-diphosphate pyrophosphatase
VKTAGAARVAVVGTSAMRDASGGEELLEHVKRAFGVEVRVLSGLDEARVSFLGATSGMGYSAESGQLAVFDIGGGSTEIVLGEMGAGVGAPPKIRYACSFDIGSVRLTERHLRHDPPTATELAAVTTAVSTAFSVVPSVEMPGSASSRDTVTVVTAPIGVAGTVTTLAAIALDVHPYDGARVHGQLLTTKELRSAVTMLASKPLALRRAVPGLEPKRADVIVAGGLIALGLLDQWSAPAIRVSDRGVRWGVAHELANSRS